MRAAYGLGARLRQGEITHLALLDETLHRADGLFDRHRRIDAVQAVDVDHVDAEAPERCVARLGT